MGGTVSSESSVVEYIVCNEDLLCPTNIHPNVGRLGKIHEGVVGNLKIIQAVPGILKNVVVQVIERAILYHQGVTIGIYPNTYTASRRLTHVSDYGVQEISLCT